MDARARHTDAKGMLVRCRCSQQYIARTFSLRWVQIRNRHPAGYKMDSVRFYSWAASGNIWASVVYAVILIVYWLSNRRQMHRHKSISTGNGTRSIAAQKNICQTESLSDRRIPWAISRIPWLHLVLGAAMLLKPRSMISAMGLIVSIDMVFISIMSYLIVHIA